MAHVRHNQRIGPTDDMLPWWLGKAEVLVEETIWNKRGQPLAGRVIAHSQEKEAVVATGVQYRKQHPDVQLFLFYAGEKIPEGVVVLL